VKPQKGESGVVSPEVALMHVGWAEGAMIVKPVAISKTFHLLAEQPRALVEPL
jgi:hypothetical protein